MFLDEDQIHRRITELAQELYPQLPPDPIVIGIMNGAFMFTADLVRALSRLGLRPRMDFITVSSYGSGVARSGKVKILLDSTLNVQGKWVLLLDDILDSGHTLKTLQRHLIDKGVAELVTAVFLDKPSGRQTPVACDHVGFSVPDGFMVGYGLDHAGNHRELPYIARMEI
ncbi:MAG TPA: hypoxanthine phosphoribosyltransferase [Magnetococcales bacterium]|nr:hypoxanthine phosphoribosyltransferase [Magnetococcales bacterium]